MIQTCNASPTTFSVRYTTAESIWRYPALTPVITASLNSRSSRKSASNVFSSITADLFVVNSSVVSHNSILLSVRDTTHVPKPTMGILLPSFRVIVVVARASLWGIGAEHVSVSALQLPSLSPDTNTMSCNTAREVNRDSMVDRKQRTLKAWNVEENQVRVLMLK